MHQPTETAQQTQWKDYDLMSKNMAAGAMLAGVVGTGVLIYFARRGRHKHDRIPTGLAGKAYMRTRDVVGDDRMEAGRKFFVKTVMPEVKPILLSIMEEIEQIVDDAFKRAEKGIKNL
jgi:hypothetical protein